MPTRKILLFSGVLFLFLFLLSVTRVTRGSAYVTREEPAMGTFVTITIESRGDCRTIFNGAFDKIRELEGIFSVHDPSSELSRLNALKEMEVSDRLSYLISRSLEISKITGGAFDITVLPLMNLYKSAEASGVQPSEERIRKELKHVGWEKIAIHGNTVKIPSGLDMGGIAKGYIVDETAEFLKKQGIKNGLVNAGGNICCFGRAPGGKKWRIGIRDPFRKNGIVQTVMLSNVAVATSGDYERYFMIKGRKYGHIINPATGRTVQNFPAGVTVIAPDASTADGFSTAFYVLGIDQSIKISDSMESIAVLMIDGNGKIYRSRNFSHFAAP